jgi:hypothetical protein
MPGSKSHCVCVCRLALISLLALFSILPCAAADSIDAQSHPSPYPSRFIVPVNSVPALSLPKSDAVDLAPKFSPAALVAPPAPETFTAVQLQATPEPGTLLLFGTGLVLIGLGFRRFLNSKAPRPTDIRRIVP